MTNVPHGLSLLIYRPTGRSRDQLLVIGVRVGYFILLMRKIWMIVYILKTAQIIRTHMTYGGLIISTYYDIS